jgi:hypothetical protein
VTAILGLLTFGLTVKTVANADVRLVKVGKPLNNVGIVDGIKLLAIIFSYVFY